MPRTLAPAALTVRNALTRNRLLPAGDDPPSSYITFTMIVRATCLIRNGHGLLVADDLAQSLDDAVLLRVGEIGVHGER